MIVVIVKMIKAFLCLGSLRSMRGNLASSLTPSFRILFLSRIIPTGIIKSPKIMKPGRIMYINSPRFVFPLLKIVEIMKRRKINPRFIPAMIEPIIVNQFLEDGGSFIEPVN